MFGVIGNGDRDPNMDYGSLIRQTLIAMMVLSLLALCLRFASRWVAKQPIKADDWFIVTGTAFAWGTSIVLVLGTDFGFGKHLLNIKPFSENLRKFLIGLFTLQPLYLCSVAFIKFSIIAFYRRIFRVQSTKMPAYIIVGITIIWLVGLLLAGILSCIPVHGFWDRSVKAKCLPTSNYFWAIAIPNLATDIMLMIFPIPLVWRLRMPISQKIGLIFTFTLGGFIILVSSLHLVTIVAVGHNLDITYILVPLGLWNGIECNIGAVLASLPSMVPLLRLAVGQRLRSVKNSHTVHSGSTSGRMPQWLRSKQDRDSTTFSRLHELESTNEALTYPSAVVTKVTGATELDKMELDPARGMGITVRTDVQWE